MSSSLLRQGLVLLRALSGGCLLLDLDAFFSHSLSSLIHNRRLLQFLEEPGRILQYACTIKDLATRIGRDRNSRLSFVNSKDEREPVYCDYLPLSIFAVPHDYYLCSFDSHCCLKRTLPTLPSGGTFWAPVNGLLVDFVAGLDSGHRFSTSHAIQ